MMPIRLRIPELRAREGWTQGELAERAGVSRATVNRLERRRPASLDFAVLEKLADALNCPPGDLLERVPAEATPED